MRICHVAHTGEPEAGCQARESRGQRQEDQEEDQVGTNGADEVHQAQQTHEKQEECICIEEGWVFQTCLWCSNRILCESSPSAIEGLKSSAEREPEGTKGSEDDGGECVTQNQLLKINISRNLGHLADCYTYLEETCNDHQYATEVDVNCDIRGAKSSQGPSPVHQEARQWSQREQETAKTNWRWIAECLPQITFDSILGRQVQLLEQLWRHDDAASSFDLGQGIVA